MLGLTRQDRKVGLKLYGDVYRGKRVLLTGHTGFKGSWLALWLHQLGAQVAGIALPPEASPSHWEMLSLPIDSRIIDIREEGPLLDAVRGLRPDIVFHLAAQPLVRRSYQEPLMTWSTNVVGTANVLEACRQTSSVRAIVAVTTDKCYENREWPWGYRETDRLGGHDPYSASKAAAELVVTSYRRAFFDAANAPLLASARAGNVIGGGDWSQDRLIPDLVRATSQRSGLEVRSPAATRPWQHVLESLSGYLQLGERLLDGDRSAADAWNFGPQPEGNRSVADVLAGLQRHWPEMRWHVADGPRPHESTLLYLDSSKARQMLHWHPVWSFDEALARTAAWYRAWQADVQPPSREQLAAYVDDAARGNAAWVAP